MQVIAAAPPLMDEIDAAFKVRGQPVFFAWGDVIYNPMGLAIPPPIMAHERVHGGRQLAYPGGVEAWWRRYIADMGFRLAEEVLGHHAELQWHMAHESSRNGRRLALTWVAERLSNPMYGYALSRERAKVLLRAASGDTPEKMAARRRLGEWAAAGGVTPESGP